MEILVLGPGCQKCRKTEEYVRNVLKRKGIVAVVKHITDVNDISEFGVLMTPGLVINGVVVHQGSIPTESQIEKYLQKTGGLS